MKIQLTPDLKRATRRCIWFEPPEQAVQDIPRLAAYILTYGTPEDIFTLREQIDDTQLQECLDHAPPGIFDKRSWAYWNLVIGRYTPPPLPERKLENIKI